jgi:TM2 domain-containing membrane protein YozV
MSIFNLDVPVPGSESSGTAIEPVALPKPKRAWIAFVLSLVIPGTGQMYAGRFNAGLGTLLVFFLSLLVALAGYGSIAGGYGLYFAVSLYIYGFLDAYFSALESNAGIAGLITGGNPRTAATLNFMTNGFGYFYLGERGKGLVMFLGLGVVRTLLNLAYPGNPWLMLLWVLMQCVLAWDAWRIAHNLLLRNSPELAGHSWRAGVSGQMSPVLPVAVACLVGLPFAGILLFGVVGQGASKIDAKTAQTKTTSEGVIYTNPRYGLTAKFPVGWVLDSKPGRLSASSSENTCSMILLREFLFKTPHTYRRSVEEALSKKEGFSVHDERDDWLDGRPAATMTVSVGTRVTEELYFTRAGRSLYTLTVIGSDIDPGCPRELESIRRNLHFSH